MVRGAACRVNDKGLIPATNINSLRVKPSGKNGAIGEFIKIASNDLQQSNKSKKEIQQ